MEPEKNSIVEPQEDDCAEDGKGKLSKGQLKKEKEKKKKEAEKAAKAAEEATKKQQENVKVADSKEEEKLKEQEPKQTGKKTTKKGQKKPNAAALLALKALEQKRKQDQEEEKQRKAFEQQRRREQEAEKEKERLAQLARDKKRDEKNAKKKKDKDAGLYVSNRHKDKIIKNKLAKEQFEKMKQQQADSDVTSSQEEDTDKKITPDSEVAANSEKPQAQIKDQEKLVEGEKVEKPQVEQVPQQPKKKYVKKKEKTLEQIYAEALKAKEQKEKLKQQMAEQGETVQNWQQLQKPIQSQPVVNKPAEPQPAKQAQPKKLTAQQEKAKEREQRRRKKREKLFQEQQAEKKQEPQLQILKNHKEVFVVDKEVEFRSPICCILGHVDTGKTTLLDKIRNTHVQQSEAGGITQQIGATFFPKNKLLQQVAKCKEFLNVNVNVPGLLIIDTPGHESFANLRSRGSSLCDIAILVIDLMHGLEQQTIESINLLRDRGTPFVVALNKIDRTYDWKVEKDRPSYLALKSQQGTTISDYNNRLKSVITQLNQKGLNACMYWENEDPLEYVSLIPTSGITGEGLPDLLSILVQYSLNIDSIRKRIRLSTKNFNCTVMEVKMVEGHGTTVDCILVDGKIKSGDQIVLLGFNGPIVTKIKALLTPHPMKQMRVKNEFLYHDEMIAANGVKISAPGLEEAVAGTPLIVANTEDEVDDAIDLCNNEYENIKNKIKLSQLGVGVAASTLGSLEALLDYLNKQKIPVAYVSVGPVAKDDVFKATKSLLSENPEKRKKEYCCLLAFDVKILPQAQKYAEDNNIKIFTADIIYHLTDHFNQYVKEVREERKTKEGKDAVFPCILKQVQVFRKNDPIVLGVQVEEGVLKSGTPLCVYHKDSDRVRLGIVQSIQSNHKKIKQARKVTGSVAIQLGGDPKITAGKDFKAEDKLVSMLTRKSIDLLKEHFRDDVSKEQWAIVRDLKPFFKIP